MAGAKNLMEQGWGTNFLVSQGVPLVGTLKGSIITMGYGTPYLITDGLAASIPIPIPPPSSYITNDIVFVNAGPIRNGRGYVLGPRINPIIGNNRYINDQAAALNNVYPGLNRENYFYDNRKTPDGEQ